MKKIKEMISLEQLKFNGYFLIIVASILVVISYIVIQPEEVSYDETFKVTQNILAQEPISFNDTYNGNFYYHPRNYVVDSKTDNTIMLSAGDAKFTIFFGNDEVLGEDYLSSINSEHEILFSVDTVDEVEGIEYFYIWKYPENEDYIEVLIGTNDKYIAGVFPDESKANYIEDMSYILNSIRKEE